MGRADAHRLTQQVFDNTRSTLRALVGQMNPSFKKVRCSSPTGQRSPTFQKLSLYCPLFDFSDPTKNVKEKEIKRQTLLEVVDYVATANTKFSENAIQKAVRMVSANVFRTLRLIASPETETKLIVFVLPFLLHPSKTIIQTSSGLFIIQSLHEYRALHRCMHEA
ncbi:hypothetical protein YC2023_097079 [Brassica napus]